MDDKLGPIEEIIETGWIQARRWAEEQLRAEQAHRNKVASMTDEERAEYDAKVKERADIINAANGYDYEEELRKAQELK